MLFEGGKSVKGDFLRVVYAFLKHENQLLDTVPVVLFTVGKKTLPSAIHRNQVKRMMREAYRLDKSVVQKLAASRCNETTPEKLCIALLYMGRRKVIPSLAEFRKEISEVMGKIPLS